MILCALEDTEHINRYNECREVWLRTNTRPYWTFQRFSALFYQNNKQLFTSAEQMSWLCEKTQWMIWAKCWFRRLKGTHRNHQDMQCFCVWGGHWTLGSQHRCSAVTVTSLNVFENTSTYGFFYEIYLKTGQRGCKFKQDVD